MILYVRKVDMLVEFIIHHAGRKEGDVLIIVMVCVLMVIDFQFFGIELCVGRESEARGF